MGPSIALAASFESITGDRTDDKKYLDQLKGFAYLETFRELQDWHEDEVDPLQRANTPLFTRPRATARSGQTARSRVMLIHDYAGGYNDYESCQGTLLQNELYSCRYLQWVDTFVYFAHKLVTIPPPTWTNTLHRNGVQALGTFITEPGTTDVDRMFDEDENGSFCVAGILARMAKVYGFDGWLINLEVPFSPLLFRPEKLERFLRQLRTELGHDSRVVWYDALTPLNFVWYQNSLNHLNLSFALAAGSFLSNYAWNPDVAQQAKQLAEQSGLGVENLYLGIDIWAQNVQQDPKHRRTTWPRSGGGGTGTGLGMRALQDLGGLPPGAGLFAPAWSFEHFPDIAPAVDESMWLGKYLPSDWSCDCGPSMPHSAVPYQHNGITRYARHGAAGTDCFFHTDFTGAFSRDRNSDALYAHIGSQQPSMVEKSVELISDEKPHNHVGYLSTSVADIPSRCVLKVDTGSGSKTKSATAGRLTLVELGISRQQDLLVSVRYSRVVGKHCTVFLVLEGSSGTPLTIELSSHQDRASTARAMAVARDGHISGASLHFRCDDTSALPAGETYIVELHAITVQPWLRPPSGCDPRALKAEHRGPADVRHIRLSWEIEFFPGTSGVPVSGITGPCAFFTIHRDGKEMGRAYALEFVVPGIESDDWKALGESTLEVTAIGFDGLTLGTLKAIMAWPIDYETDWVLVTPACERASFL